MHDVGMQNLKQLQVINDQYTIIAFKDGNTLQQEPSKYQNAIKDKIT